MAVSDAKREANDKYDEKTYTRYTIKLRTEDDRDIIESLEAARAEGLKLREWLRELFDNQK